MQNNNNPQAIVKGLKFLADAVECHAAKKYAEAADLYRRALLLMPNHPKLLAKYAELAEEVQDWPSAEKLYRRLGALRPDSNFEARLAHALFKQERYEEAIPLFKAHLAREPNEPGILHGLSNALGCLGRWSESLGYIRRAAKLTPTYQVIDAELNAIYHLGMIEELDARMDKELARFPDSREIRSLYALHKLKSGDFENGFKYYMDVRWRNNQRTWAEKEAAGIFDDDWDGKRFDGILVFNAEQGLGDEIMLSSIFDDIFATGQEVIVRCDKRLIPLYQHTYPQMQFRPRREATEIEQTEGRTNRVISALDAARLFRNRRDKFPARRSWLHGDPARQQALHDAYRARWPNKRLVGISWKSKRVVEGGNKNIDLADFAPLLRDPDSVFISLQYGDTAEDIARLREHGIEIFVEPTVDATQDLDGLAALIGTLDLVISTSNTTVHIAGAIGVPCWLLLPKISPILWYWGYRGDTTPWYPSLRLLRNTSENDWSGLISTVATELAALPVPSQ